MCCDSMFTQSPPETLSVDVSTYHGQDYLAGERIRTTRRLCESEDISD